jgi:simple sugar transport system ATP-binding protein
MRGGRHVSTVDKKAVSIPDLARDMVGRDVFLNSGKKAARPGDCVLSVRGIFVPSEREHSKLRGLSFDLYRGEVLGVAGVDGNGQSELVEALTGLRPVERGEILLKNSAIHQLPVREIRSRGLAHIPDDRNIRGLNRKFSIKENLIAVRYTENTFSRFGIFARGKIDGYAGDLVRAHDIRPGNINAGTGNLSGGNAQKVVFAREIDTEFDVLIAAQPTRGVDIGSIEAIRGLINRVKEQGKAVLLVSADLDEILALSDRIMVMYEGRIAGIVPAEKATEENIGLMMTGAYEEHV